MNDVETLLEELRDLAAREVLSHQQVDVLLARRNKVSYEQIQRQFGLSGATALVHCLVRTASARWWTSGMSGGTDGYLAAPDEARFRDMVQSACDEVNCITSHVALSLALQLQKERISRARRILVGIGCERLLSHLPDPESPSRSWLNGVCSDLKIRICRAQELELARRLFCDRDTIIQWFLQFGTLFDRPLELLFNMDETYLTSKRILHCLCPDDRQPLISSLPVTPHITGVVTIHGGGRRIRPMVVLPKKKTLSTLEGFTNYVYLGSSTSGWMTKNLFRFYALTFVSELSLLKLSLPAHLRDEPVLLFLDGHPSRWDFRANLVFWLFNVDVVSFPGHCSHLLQMFDVVIASLLKQEFKKELSSARFEQFLRTLSVADFSVRRKQTASEMRTIMIESFATAFERVCTRKNCRSSFSATGVSPYCPDRVLESEYAVDPPADGIFPNRVGRANSRWLTSDDSLREMFREEFGRELTADDLCADISRIHEEIKTSNLDQGIPLSEAPEILIEVNQERIYRLCSVSKLHR